MISWQRDLSAWIVEGYDASRAALRHPELSSATVDNTVASFMSENQRLRFASLTGTLRRWAVVMDPPAHTWARDQIRHYFSAGRLRRLADRIGVIAEECVGAIGPDDDLIPVLAERVPLLVMAELLGVPQRYRRHLPGWATDLADWFAAMYRSDHASAAEVALAGMRDALRAGAGSEGLWDHIAHTDEDDALATCAMVLFGGLETSSSLLGSVLYALLTEEATVAAVRDGGRPAADALVERQLVLRPPLGHVLRVARTDLVLEDQPIGAGNLVVVSLDCGREPADRHLSFGDGVHYCIGAPLARLEGALLGTAFVTRFPRSSLQPDGVVWGGNRTYRRLVSLRMAVP